MSDFSDSEIQELLADFFQEATQQGESLEQNILALENDPRDREAVDELFRAAHTLKGGAATVGMKKLADITHLMEDVLDEIRSARRDASEEVIECLLASIDLIKSMIENGQAGKKFDPNTSALEKRLTSLKGAAGTETKKADDRRGASQPPKPAKAAGEKPVLSEYDLLELKEAAAGSRSLFEISIDFDEENLMNTVGGIQVYAALKRAGKIVKTVPDFDRLYQDNFYPVITYYLATDEPAGRIEDLCTIPEVTLGVRVTPLAVDADGRGAGSPDDEAESAGEAIAADEESDERAESAGEGAEPSREASGDAAAETERTRRVTGSVLRVDSRRIDQLLNLVSEVVINKASFNQLIGEVNSNFTQFQTRQDEHRETLKELFESLPEYVEEATAGKSAKAVKKDMLARFGNLGGIFNQYEASLKDTMGHLKGITQNLARIASELQEGVMKIRMVPIAQIFSRFPRLVRDLSKSLRKQVKLTIQGENTELDKSVIEDLLDPLIHCVRNSIDHGIEDPATRKRLGKEPEGNVVLKAGNEGNMVVIEISDDGRGIDVELVRKKAVKQGILHESKLLSDIEAYNLIFEPGFSTSSVVTDVSGRGVGLDVVKKQIEKLSGMVSVWSEPGRGAKFTIKLPLTLAIIQGLLVRVGKNVFAIPVSSVMETLKVRLDDIKRIDNYEVFNLRDDVISLVRLHTLFHIESAVEAGTQYIVVVGSKGPRIGILVDSLIGEEDVVIKPLKDRFTKSPGIAGASILGDGTVSLIIDVAQLLELGMRIGSEERRQREKAGLTEKGNA
ncbi:MAG: chemotaxis protein CheA [Spirochaetales bacterium]|nr:chemotaxis protein CheA [Spirochaetales bacterium]